MDVKKNVYVVAEICKRMESPFLWALSELLTDTKNQKHSSTNLLLRPRKLTFKVQILKLECFSRDIEQSSIFFLIKRNKICRKHFFLAKVISVSW